MLKKIEDAGDRANSWRFRCPRRSRASFPRHFCGAQHVKQSDLARQCFAARIMAQRRWIIDLWQWMVYNDNPIKIDDLGVPAFMATPYIYIYMYIYIHGDMMKYDNYARFHSFSSPVEGCSFWDYHEGSCFRRRTAISNGFLCPQLWLSWVIPSNSHL